MTDTTATAEPAAPAEFALEFVTPRRPWATMNALLFGDGGSGKTTGACSAPAPILYLNAEGEGALEYARKRLGNPGPDKLREYLVSSKDRLDAGIRYLVSPAGADVKTVVLDSVGELYRLLVEHFAGGPGRKPEIQHFGEAGDYIERLSRMLRDRDVNVVWIAHELNMRNEATGTLERLPFTGSSSNAKLGRKIGSHVDVVAYCAPEVAADGTASYVARVGPGHPGVGCAKDRTDVLGRVAPLSFGQWLRKAQAEAAPNTPAAPAADPTPPPLPTGDAIIDTEVPA